MSNVNKNKVLFVITKGSPFGGAQRYVYDLATNAPDGFEAVVACGMGEDLPNALREKGVRVVQIKNLQREISAGKDWTVFKELVKIIKEERPNIVHLNSSKIGFLGALAILCVNFLFIIHNSKFKIHSIFTAHGWAFNEQNRSNLFRTISYIGHYFTVLLCNTTIAVSNKAKQDIVWLPFIKNKIRVIYNGIAKFKLKSKREARLILLGDENSPPAQTGKKMIIYSISELHNNKGIDIALRGIARLPDKLAEKIIYCIAGDGEERENLQKLAKEIGVQTIVRFLGFVPNAKELLSGANIFLLPSRTEAFPYVLLEAGIARVPVIATNTGGISEIVSDMQNGILVHSRNSREISEAILYIIENPLKAKMFREKISETIASKFLTEKMIAETYSLYRLLLG